MPRAGFCFELRAGSSLHAVSFATISALGGGWRPFKGSVKILSLDEIRPAVSRLRLVVWHGVEMIEIVKY